MSALQDEINDLEIRLARYRATEAAILEAGQSYSINPGGASRMLTRADLEEVRKAIDRLEARLARLKSRRGRGPIFRPAVPLDDI